MSSSVRSRRLSAYLRPPARVLGPLVVALAAMTVLPLVGPYLVSQFVDGAVAGRSTTALVGLAGGYLATAVGARARNCWRRGWPSGRRGRGPAVLDQLGLGTWVGALPDGLDTRIGPGGAGLSAGEAQLLAFARAFCTGPGRHPSSALARRGRRPVARRQP